MYCFDGISKKIYNNKIIFRESLLNFIKTFKINLTIFVVIYFRGRIIEMKIKLSKIFMC